MAAYCCLRMLRYALLGGGMMGREHIRNLALIDDAEVVAIAEPNQAMQARCKKLLPDVVCVTSLDELLQLNSFDALIIATPNYQHAGQLLQIFEKTSLPILVEKPVVTERDDIVRIRDAAARHGAPVWVAMEYRYMPPLQSFLDQLDRVGELQTLSIREHRFPFLKKVDDWNRFNRNSGGTLVEKCCHFFDLFRLIMADEVSHVYASAGQNHNHLEERYNGETPDLIDNAFVTMEFSRGRRAMLDLNMFAEGAAFQEEICAVGTSGRLECLIPGPEQTWPEDRSALVSQVVYSPRHPRGPITTEVNVDDKLMQAGSHHGSTFYEHLGFKRAIEAAGPIEVSVEDGLKAVVIGMAAQLSAQHHQAVALFDGGLDFKLA